MFNNEERTEASKGVKGVQAVVGRALGICVVVAFGVASVLPLLYGSVRDRAPPVPEPIVFVEYGNVTCPDFTPQVLELQLQLASSQNEVRGLFEQLQSLQSQIRAFEVPVCTVSELLSQAVSEYKSQQELLHTTIAQVQSNLTAATNDIQLVLQDQQIKYNHHIEFIANLSNAATLISAEVNETRSMLGQRESDAKLLLTVDTLSSSVAASLGSLDERLTKVYELETAIAELSTEAASFTCPDPIIPAVVVPEVKVNCPVPPPPLPVLIPAPVFKTEEVEELPPRTCVEVAEAKELVANMVFTELELLKQNLSRYCDVSLEATLGACRSAAENTASSALEEYSTENARLHAEHAEFMAAEAEAEAAFRAQVLLTKAQCPPPTQQPRKQGDRNTMSALAAAVNAPVPESKEALDYALLSAGSSVVLRRTSDTYFPAEWNLANQLRDTLHWAGVQDASTVSSAVEMLGVGSGWEVYESLNLHKAVGVPENALTADTHRGSCWPMKGRSGSLTVRMAGAVFLSAVSIDHPRLDAQAGPLRTAPRKFEVFGISSENGVERLLVVGTYNNSLGAPVTQTFQVRDDAHRSSDEPYQTVSLRVLSNHGHPDYTCLYRFRVHGIPLP